MSIIDITANSVTAYVSGTTKPFSGQRLSVVNYRTVTNKESADFNSKKPSLCVSLPVISPEDVKSSLPLLMPALIDYLASVQDKIIRPMIDAGSKSILASDVGINSIVEFLQDSSGTGERLTKEVIGAWFSESIADTLMLTLASKLGIPDSREPTQNESDKIEAIVTEYKDKICALAGGKTSYNEKLAVSIKKCLDLAGSEDVMASKFHAKLDKMIAASIVKIDLFELL